jgi:hypothetical protein
MIFKLPLSGNEDAFCFQQNVIMPCLHRATHPGVKFVPTLLTKDVLHISSDYLFDIAAFVFVFS